MLYIAWLFPSLLLFLSFFEAISLSHTHCFHRSPRTFVVINKSETLRRSFPLPFQNDMHVKKLFRMAQFPSIATYKPLVPFPRCFHLLFFFKYLNTSDHILQSFTLRLGLRALIVAFALQTSPESTSDPLSKMKGKPPTTRPVKEVSTLHTTRAVFIIACIARRKGSRDWTRNQAYVFKPSQARADSTAPTTSGTSKYMRRGRLGCIMVRWGLGDCIEAGGQRQSRGARTPPLQRNRLLTPQLLLLSFCFTSSVTFTLL